MNPEKARRVGANKLLLQEEGLTVRQYRRILMGKSAPSLPHGMGEHPEFGMLPDRHEADAHITARLDALWGAA